MAVAVELADPLTDSFPEYIDPFEPFEIMTAFSPSPVHKTVSGVQASEPASRYPSPQPSHLCLPHQAKRKATMGYVAPTFLEKPTQVKEGKNTPSYPLQRSLALWALTRDRSQETPP